VGFGQAQVLGNSDAAPGLSPAQGLAFDIGATVDIAVQAFELLNGGATARAPSQVLRTR